MERFLNPHHLSSTSSRPRRSLALLAMATAAAIPVSSAFLAAPKAARQQRPLAAAGKEENDDSDAAASGAAGTRGGFNPFRSAVLKLGMTEPRYSSKFNGEIRSGVYRCGGCGLPLFDSEDKYNSGSGWPSFMRWKGEEDGSTVKGSPVKFKKEWDGRVEIQCSRCGGHHGHVFPDGPSQLKGGTGKRYCVNGVALDFEPAPLKKWDLSSTEKEETRASEEQEV